MVKLILFSKNRAAQLDAHLQSIFANDNSLFSSIDVIYTASDEDFERAYQVLIRDWVDPLTPLKFHREDEFRIDLLDILDNSTDEFVCFGVDDNIIYKEIPLDQWDVLNCLGHEGAACLSLRLGQNTSMQCLYTNQFAQMPEWTYGVGGHKTEILAWNWRKMPPHQNFGYPMSVDYHIFDTKKISSILQNCQFSNPNSLECSLQGQKNRLGDLMYCLPESAVVNLPLNRVQSICENNFGKFYGVSERELNDLFLRGQRISLEDMRFDGVICTHQEFPLSLKQYV